MSLRRLQHARLRKWTRSEFDKLADMGLFEGERVELIRGVAVQMASAGAPDAKAIQTLAGLLEPKLAGRAEVRTQQPFVAADESEPLADLVVVPPRPPAGTYPDQASLIVEVADDSLDYDRTTKAWLYAETKIEEYWVVDLTARAVEVFRNPTGDRYDSVTRHGQDDTLTPRAFKDIQIPVAAIFA